MSTRENWRAEADAWLDYHRKYHNSRTPTVAELEAHFSPTCGHTVPNLIYGFIQALQFSITGQLQPVTTEEPASVATIEAAWGIAKPAATDTGVTCNPITPSTRAYRGRAVVSCVADGQSEKRLADSAATTHHAGPPDN